MSLPSKSPRSSRAGSLTNLFGLGTSRNQEIELAHDHHESGHLPGKVLPVPRTSTPRDDENHGEHFEYDDVETSRSMAFTQNHPLGKILMELVTDNNKSKKGSKDKENALNMEWFSQNFYEAMQMDARARDRQAEIITKTVQNDLLKRDLTSHTLSMDIQPPMCFAPRPVMTNIQQRAECLKIFPSRNKFGGFNKEHSIDVVEFLHTMNAAQRNCKVSLEEFKEMLLACTTGNPNVRIRSWINDNYSLNTIYHYLQLHFDTRISPTEASNQLSNYKAPKTLTLAKVQAHVMELAERTATQVPEGDTRSIMYDVDFVKGLINCLPLESQHMVRTKYHELSARLRRAATASELSQALHSIRHIIDADISKNGADKTHRHQGPTNKDSKAIGKFKPFKRSSVFAIQTPVEDDLDQNVTDPPGQIYVGTFHNATDRRTGQQQQQTQSHRARGNSNVTSAKNNHDNKKSSYTPRQNTFNKFSKVRNTSNAHGSSTDYCSLCGKQDHKAADGCPYMVDDNGVRVDVLPTHTNCSECPAYIKRRLNHPMQLCPYRKGTGPLKHRA